MFENNHLLPIPSESLIRTRSGIVYLHLGDGLWIDERGAITRDFAFYLTMQRSIQIGYARML